MNSIELGKWMNENGNQNDDDDDDEIEKRPAVTVTVRPNGYDGHDDGEQ